jgi:hypothetical protein
LNGEKRRKKMGEEDKLVELTRIVDPVEADLVAAFLEDDELEFQMRRNARTMASIMPASEVPTVFMVYEADLERAKDLLEEYRKVQAASLPPDDAIDPDETV